MRKSESEEGSIKSQFFLPADLDEKNDLCSGLFYKDFSRIVVSYMWKGTWNNLDQCLPITASENSRGSFQVLLTRDFPSVDLGWG